MKSSNEMEQHDVLRVKMEVLKQEHRDLDMAIDALQTRGSPDMLTIKRLKKQKLALKDRIDELADGDNLMEAAVWRIAKNEYSELIKPLSNSEIAETFFNSIYCKYFDHQNINPELLFVLPAADQFSRGIDPDGSIFNHYYAHNNLTRMLESILSDYDFGLKFEDLANNVRQMRSTILKELPATLIRNREAFAVIHKSIFYRSKAAYLIGKVISAEMTVPFVIPILQNEHGEIYVDTLMFDPDDLSVLFSYTRAYFKVDAPVPSEIVRFLKELMPWKPYSELYNSIGFNRHGKTEFYREYLHHVENSADQFVLAPGIKGMVMSVFTLPSFDRVFKVIKDRFDPPKNMSRQTVKEKYNLVSRHDRAGRMADTQEYSNLTFPRHRFSEELLDELKKVASSSLEIDEQTVLIKHLYVERKMIPLNIFFETATEEQTAQTIDEYGNAIRQLASANIFSRRYAAEKLWRHATRSRGVL